MSLIERKSSAKRKIALSRLFHKINFLAFSLNYYFSQHFLTLYLFNETNFPKYLLTFRFLRSKRCLTAHKEIKCILTGSNFPYLEVLKFWFLFSSAWEQSINFPVPENSVTKENKLCSQVGKLKSLITEGNTYTR